MRSTEILAALPRAEQLLELTERELQVILLRYLRAVTDDPLRRMATCEGTITSLFGSEGYPAAMASPVRKAITRAWRALEAAGLIEEPDTYNGKNGYRVISDEGRSAPTMVDLEAAHARGWLKPELVHAALHGASLNAFFAADYDTAVFEAFKAVESAVRRKAPALAALFGVALMRQAFDPTNGPLSDPSASTSRRAARQSLFVGAMGELRNPKAHGDPTITDPRVAIEELMTASMLLRIIG